MAKNNPTQIKHEANLLNALNFFHRSGNYPLDDTSVWSTLADFEAYLNEDGSYRYPGQLVAVTNGDAYDETNNKDVTLVAVRPDGTPQIIGAELVFDSADVATTYIMANPNVASAGKLVTIKEDNKYTLHIIDDPATGTTTRVSFDVADVPEVTWENLKNKPTSTVEEIDTAVGKTKDITAGEKLLYKGNAVAYTSDIPTEYDAAKVKSVDGSKLPLDVIPQGALERLVPVANEAARLALTNTDVQNGDVVKEIDTELLFYVVADSKLGTAEAADAFESFRAGSAASVPWSGVQNKPTTVAASGLTDAVAKSDVKNTVSEDGTPVGWNAGNVKGVIDTEADIGYEINGKAKNAAIADEAKKAADSVKLNGQNADYYATAESVTEADNMITGLTTRMGTAETNISGLQSDVTNLKSGAGVESLDVSKLNGVIDEANLPASVKERLKNVDDIDARNALTTTDVQLGDIVKVGSTGLMYVVKDTANLGNESGYEVFNAANANTLEGHAASYFATAADLTAANDAASALETRVSTNETNISNNAKAIEANATAIEANAAKINTNESNIQTLMDNMINTIRQDATAPEGVSTGQLWLAPIA